MKNEKIIIFLLIFLLLIPFNFNKTFALADGQDESLLNSTIAYINNAIYNDLGTDINTSNSTYNVAFYFRDDYSSAYRVIYINTGSNTLDSRFGVSTYLWGGGSDYSTIIFGAGNNCPIYLYSVFDDTSKSAELTSSTNITGWKTIDLNTQFGLNCFSTFTFMYVSYNENTDKTTTFSNWNNLFAKSAPIMPYNKWNGSSPLKDSTLIIHPRKYLLYF